MINGEWRNKKNLNSDNFNKNMSHVNKDKETSNFKETSVIFKLNSSIKLKEEMIYKNNKNDYEKSYKLNNLNIKLNDDLMSDYIKDNNNKNIAIVILPFINDSNKVSEINDKIEDIKLVNSWILYDHEKGNNKNYDKSCRTLCTFCTIGEYWFYTNLLPYPSKLFYKIDIGKPYYKFSNNSERSISSISLFKKEILPKWEDINNKDGGEIFIRQFIKKNISQYDCLDNYWNILSMFCISEMSEYSKYINGIRIVDSSIPHRQLYRLELWFSDNTYHINIENEFKKILDLDESEQIFFKTHKNSE